VAVFAAAMESPQQVVLQEQFESGRARVAQAPGCVIRPDFSPALEYKRLKTIVVGSLERQKYVASTNSKSKKR
jgi:hypothetical protein